MRTATNKKGLVSGLVRTAVCLVMPVITLLGMAACSSSTSEGSETFDAEAIEAMRKEKDASFASDAFSPIPKEERAAFRALEYFPPSAEYRVEAEFTAAAEPPILKLQTSKSNDVRTYERAGEFSFTLNGVECTLAAYRQPSGKHTHMFFVPFLDATSGNTSYAAGRYLDIEEQKGATTYIIDFNLAYNPYCAYNESYSCPLVPDENKLAVAVKAGEKYSENESKY